MDEFKQYAIPYIISNVFAVLCIGGALQKPAWTRIFLAGFFLWTSYINTKTALYEPAVYLDYGRLHLKRKKITTLSFSRL